MLSFHDFSAVLAAISSSVVHTFSIVFYLYSAHICKYCRTYEQQAKCQMSLVPRFSRMLMKFDNVCYVPFAGDLKFETWHTGLSLLGQCVQDVYLLVPTCQFSCWTLVSTVYIVSSRYTNMPLSLEWAPWFDWGSCFVPELFEFSCCQQFGSFTPWSYRCLKLLEMLI